jgi:hypothetical protein
MMQSVLLQSSDDESDWENLGYDVPDTPTSDEPRGSQSLGRQLSDGDSDEEAGAHAHGELVPRTKPGGYDSRIEQMLYENPELPILITDAGKSQESGGRYIVYTIKTAVSLPCGYSARNIRLTFTGTCRASPLLRVCLVTGCSYSPAPHTHHSTNTREAYHGRLRGKSDKCEARSANNRPEETDVGCVPEPLPEDGAGSNGRCLVEVSGSQFELGRYTVTVVVRARACS